MLEDGAVWTDTRGVKGRAETDKAPCKIQRGHT